MVVVGQIINKTRIKFPSFWREMLFQMIYIHFFYYLSPLLRFAAYKAIIWSFCRIVSNKQ